MGHCHIMNYVSPGGGNLSTSIFIGGLRMLFLLQVNKNQGFLTYYSCRKVVVFGGKIPKDGHQQVKQGKGSVLLKGVLHNHHN